MSKMIYFLLVVPGPKSDFFEKLMNSEKESVSYGEGKIIFCSERLDTLVRANKDLQYQKECYKDFSKHGEYYEE